MDKIVEISNRVWEVNNQLNLAKQQNMPNLLNKILDDLIEFEAALKVYNYEVMVCLRTKTNTRRDMDNEADDMIEWCDRNKMGNSDWMATIGGNYIFMFNHEADAVAFKLAWVV